MFRHSDIGDTYLTRSFGIRYTKYPLKKEEEEGLDNKGIERFPGFWWQEMPQEAKDSPLPWSEPLHKGHDCGTVTSLERFSHQVQNSFVVVVSSAGIDLQWSMFLRHASPNSPERCWAH